MKFMDSVIGFRLKTGKQKMKFVHSDFWIRAFDREEGILVVFSSIQKTSPCVLRKISDAMANKIFKELKIVLEEFNWIEHFPKLSRKARKRETFLKVDHKVLGNELCRVSERAVFLEQIEHWIGEELEAMAAPRLENKNKIELEGYE